MIIKTLQFFRVPNLIIVFLTQYLIRYSVLYPIYKSHQIDFFLSEAQFLFLVIATVLLTAGGYIINDIYDYKIDAINKPEKVFIEKHITIKNAYFIYWLINFTGFFISFWIALEVDYLQWLIFYPSGWFFLWWYSYKLKKTLIWGNLLVSFFCAFVALLIWFSEKESFSQLSQLFPITASHSAGILIFYAVFAFVSNMFREISKDMEDVKGDKLYGCQTLPILYGYKKSQSIALMIAITLLILIILFIGINWSYLSVFSLSYCTLFLIIPLLYIFKLISVKNKNADYKKLSTISKLIMLFGLLLLPALNI